MTLFFFFFWSSTGFQQVFWSSTVFQKVAPPPLSKLWIHPCALSSLLDIYEDEHTESAIPTISTSLLMTTNKRTHNPSLNSFYVSLGTFDYLLEVPLITCTAMVSCKLQFGKAFSSAVYSIIPFLSVPFRRIDPIVQSLCESTSH